MNTFTLHMQSATQYEAITDVTSFVGEDDSGSFGIQAGHARMMASLRFGLARYRRGEEPWQYLALPGALLYFVDNQLFLNTRHFVRDDDYSRINTVLREQLHQEEAGLQRIKESLRRMEEEMLKRLREIQRD
ncbi:MAG: F0F1 ATP synthase subunit epsilon [Gammaproteobacteria bacterium]|jgi:F-type H+-transporting ATPase subunit epsilon